MHQLRFICPLHGTAQRDHRIALTVGGGNPGDQVRAARSGGDQRDPGLAGEAPYRCGHKRRVRFVAHGNDFDGGIEQGIKHFVDFCTRNTENLLHALRFQLAYDHIGAMRPLTCLFITVHGGSPVSFRRNGLQHQGCWGEGWPVKMRCRQAGRSSVCEFHRRSARRSPAGSRADARRPDDRR